MKKKETKTKSRENSLCDVYKVLISNLAVQVLIHIRRWIKISHDYQIRAYCKVYEHEHEHCGVHCTTRRQFNIEIEIYLVKFLSLYIIFIFVFIFLYFFALLSIHNNWLSVRALHIFNAHGMEICVIFDRIRMGNINTIVQFDHKYRFPKNETIVHPSTNTQMVQIKTGREKKKK